MPRRVWWVFFLGSLLPAAASPAPLFPPGCAVVLLAGLPGDIESENSFRQQLEDWVELATTGGQAQKLFVLYDAPETVRLPANIEANILKADRKNFLSLAEVLSGVTNRLVVLAWGHGGRAGAQPVLHVRGPRISPADFAALAAKLPAAESHWVLMFRGSGAFARQLTAPGREVLSSDYETVFTSDPVGMSVLLKLARGSPALSFEDLARRFGLATAAWYSERNLARTEEPTLWLEAEKPRSLAKSSEGDDSFASLPAEERNAGATNRPSKQQSPRAEGASAALPAHWKGLKKVEPQKFPDEEAVILRQTLACTLGSQPAVVTEQDQFIQILTPDGKQFGDFDVTYAPPFEEIEFLDCEVLRPDGKLLRLDPDAIREGDEQALGNYQVERRKFFSLPGVMPGAVLHVHYRTQRKEFPMPRISMELPLSKELPVLRSVVQVSVPKDAPFHFTFEQLSAPDPVVKQTGYSASYTWHFEKLAAYRREMLAPPHEGPRLLISTFPDWAAFAEWYARISRLSDEVTSELAARAKELTSAATTDHERVLAIYNYVAGLRYVAVPLGVNSFRPHAAAKVLQNHYGDCKDKANLFNALLHSLNIEAHLVLVPRFSQAHEALPGFAFNHAISRVTLAGETVWADTTDDVCRFGLLPPGDPGRNVLVIDGQAAALTQLPAPVPKDHRLELRGEVNCSGRPDSWPVSLSATAFGFPDYQLRTGARLAREHRGSIPLLAMSFRPVAGSFSLEKQSATPVSAVEEDFSWHAEGTWAGLSGGEGGNRLLHSPFWVPKEWDLALHRRQGPLFLNQGYPVILDEKLEFALPPHTTAAILPAICENGDGPLLWRIEWTRIGDDQVVAHFHAELARGELSEAESPVFQRQLRSLLAALGTDAALGSPR